MRVRLVVLLLALGALAATAGDEAGDRCSYGDTMPPAAATPVAGAPGAARFRVVAYNVHSGLGGGFALGRPRAVVERNLRAIAADVAGSGPAPDVVALNEVDLGSRRSGGFDQADWLAAELSRRTGAPYRALALETWRRTVPGLEVRFGNAVLVRHPVVASHGWLLDDAGPCFAGAELPPLGALGLFARLVGERRGVLRVTLDVAGRPVDVLVTHLEAFVQAAREAQAEHLLRRFVSPDRTTVLAGDVNAVPSALTAARRLFAGDRTHDILSTGRLVDARLMLADAGAPSGGAPWATYPSDHPRWPLDAVLATPDLRPDAIGVIGGTASDHRGLTVDYALLDDPAAVAAVRARHDTLRRRQLGRILACDVPPGQARGRWAAAVAANLGDVATGAERALLLASPS